MLTSDNVYEYGGHKHSSIHLPLVLLYLEVESGD